MSPNDKVLKEQVALGLLIENAYEVFDKGLMAVAGRMILWGSFDNAEQLAQRYLQADGRAVLDKRRLANPDLTNDGFLFGAEIYSLEALEYKKWAKKHGGQPIYYEALVTYCASLENFLKAVAVVFFLSKGSSFDHQIYVPLSELSKAYKEIDDVWQKKGGDSNWLQIFYEKRIVEKSPLMSSYHFSKIDDEVWSASLIAFRLRNEIVHNMGRLSKDFCLGNFCLKSGVLELDQAILKFIAQNFRKIAHPFDPFQGY